MPTYTYRCKNCGHEFEKLQTMSAPSLLTCPECKQETLIRLIHGGAGMVFKGSGFYLTDYKKSGSSPSGSTESGKGSTASKASDGSTGNSSGSDTKSSDAKPSSSAKTDSSGTGGGTSSTA